MNQAFHRQYSGHLSATMDSRLSKGWERRFHDVIRLTIIVVAIFALLLMISVSLNDLLANERAEVMMRADSIGSKRTNKVVNGSGHDGLVSSRSASYSTHDEQNQTTTESFSKRLPKALIIGSRKSGTRALLKFLTANANIRAANKEVHFFDRLHNYKLGLDWYREQMPASWAHEITIEKSPAYFVTKEAPERIRSAMGAGIKLILIVRDPVTRLISDFSQLLAHRAHKTAAAAAAPVTVPLRDYDDYYHLVMAGEAASDSSRGQSAPEADETPLPDEVWARAEAGFEDYVRRSDGGIDDQRRAIRAGMYSLHLERWLNLFERHQIHLVDGERLISEPAAELRKVESFLGLEPVITSNDFVFNRTKGFFCLTSATEELSSESSPAPVVSSLERELAAKIANTVGSPSQAPICLGEDKGRRHVRVRKELIQELQQFYAPFNEYLYSLMGRDFNWSRRASDN